MEQYWLYMKEGKECGPVKEEEIVELIRKGVLSPETMVKSISMVKWEMAGKLDEFRSKFRMSSLSPFSQKIESPAVAQGTKDTDEKPFQAIIHEKPKVHQLYRYVARHFDYTFFGILLLAPYYFIEQSKPTSQESEMLVRIALWFSIYFLWVFIEAVLLCTWGTTPGKYIFNITVRTNEGEKLSFQQALHRSLMVYIWGMGLGLPVFSTIAMIVASIKLARNGITMWDLAGEFVFTHHELGIERGIIILLIFLAIFGLTLIEGYLEEKREHERIHSQVSVNRGTELLIINNDLFLQEF